MSYFIKCDICNRLIGSTSYRNHLIKDHKMNMHEALPFTIIHNAKSDKIFSKIDIEISKEFFKRLYEYDAKYFKDLRNYKLFFEGYYEKIVHCREFDIKEDLDNFFSNFIEWKLKNKKTCNSREFADKIFPNNKEFADKVYNDFMLAKNPYYKHKSDLSPFSPNFYIKKGYSKEESKKLAKEKYDALRGKRVMSSTVEYYLIRGYNEEEAKKIIKEKYSTRSLSHFIKKYGEVEGQLRYEEANAKWRKSLYKESSFMSRGLSSSSIELANILAKEFDGLLFGNNEKCIEKWLFDITNEKTKKIIEFNGDLWHMNPSKYKENDYNNVIKKYAYEVWNKDAEKISCAKRHGYDILTIWESDYKECKEEIIEKCIEFLG